MNDMVKSASFEEKLKDRIRDSIGELLSDEDLRRIVERGTEELLFKERIVLQQMRYGTEKAVKPPLVHECLEGLLRTRVDTVLREWLTAHADEVSGQIKRIVDDGILEAVKRAISGMMAGSMYQLQQDIENNLFNR